MQLTSQSKSVDNSWNMVYKYVIINNYILIFFVLFNFRPNKIGTFGPYFCNNQTSFRLENLDTIVPELHNRWTEIKGSKTWSKKHEGDLWKYEWKKHGTCSQSLPALDSEIKYFKQGLDWSTKYQLSELLSQGGIKPNGSYPLNQFWHTLKTGLGKNPRIDCFIDKVCG